MHSLEDFNPQTKTANINIRVAPSHKARMIERGGRLGLNLSDYVGFALEKAEKDEEKIQQFSTENERLKKELAVFYEALHPLASKAINKEIKIGEQKLVINDSAHLLQLLIQNFKLNEK